MTLSKEEKEKRLEERRQEKYNKTHKTIDGIIYKQCNHHKEFFPNENDWLPMTEIYYYINKMNGMDGFNTYCKRCTVKKSSIWGHDNPERKNISNKRDQQKPERQKYLKELSKKRRLEGKLKEWQQKNKNKISKYNKKRMNKNHRINKKEWENCLDYFDHKCAYCGMTEEEHKLIYGKQLHKEHVCDCGRNDLKNCVPSCTKCNTEKHIKSYNDWYNPDSPVYTYERYHKIYQWIRYDCKKYASKKRKNKQYNKKNTEYWNNR